MACTCATLTVCQAYSRADAVFVGTLEKVESDKASAVEAVSAHFSVERTFKGKTQKSEVARFLTGSCERKFTVGEKYFVYKESVGDFAIVCNMTNLLSESVADLEHARGLSETDPVYNISGRISGLPGDELKRVKIGISMGTNVSEVKADKNGFYNFTAKEKGDYSVRISLPYEAVIFTKVLAEEERHVGNKVEYFTQFKPNECDFREFDLKRNAED